MSGSLSHVGVVVDGDVHARTSNAIGSSFVNYATSCVIYDSWLMKMQLSDRYRRRNRRRDFDRDRLRLDVDESESAFESLVK